MTSRRINELLHYLDEMNDLRDSMIKAQDNIAMTLESLRKDMDSSFHLSHLIEDLELAIQGFDLEQVRRDVEDIENKLEALSYNFNRASKIQKKMVYQIENPFSIFQKPQQK